MKETKIYKNTKDDAKYKLWMYRSDVVKQISNSLYGVGAYNKYALFNPKVSAAVTSMSRKLIKFVEINFIRIIMVENLSIIRKVSKMLKTINTNCHSIKF